MTDRSNPPGRQDPAGPVLLRPTSRRGFLRAAAAGGVGILVPAWTSACNDDPFNPAARVSLDLRTDTGVLNALYALAQLKGEVFNRLFVAPYAGMTAAEATVFGDIRNHATAHIAYLVERLGQDRIYDLVEFDFSGVDLTTRAGALPVALRVADAVSAAHTGALLQLRDDTAFRVVAKMASVHARHSAAVRDIADASPAPAGTGVAFAGPDVVEPSTGLDVAAGVGDALDSLRGYFRTTLDVRR